MILDYPSGATPLDPDEAAGLISSHIAGFRPFMNIRYPRL